MVFRMSSPEESRQLPLSPPKLKFDSIMFRFPARLWKIVNACRSGAISWGPNGKTIRIVRSQFEALYLTSYNKPFKTDRFSSFVRQLNLYGFKKVAAPMILDGEKIEYDDLYEYRHPNFRQGRSELLTCLQRNCKKNNTNCKPSQHKGNAFDEIYQNVTWDAVDHGQSRAQFQKEERKEEKDEEQTQAQWTPENGIENHPLLRPFNRAETLLQHNPEIPLLSEQPSATVSGVVDISQESWTEFGWPKQAEHETNHVEHHGEAGITDKADSTE